MRESFYPSREVYLISVLFCYPATVMRILVTGGLGFIGSSLVRALAKEGHTVRSLDNSSRGSKETLGDAASSIEIIEGDIRDPDCVNAAVKGVDRVCHLAYVNGTEYFYKYPAYVLDVGVKGMVNVLDACMRNNVTDLVLASSSEVYQTSPTFPTSESAPLSVPDPLNPRYSYGGGKIISELMAINYGREAFERVVIFRPHNVYGPAMGFEHVIPQFVRRIVDLRSKNPQSALQFSIQGDGSQTRSFIYIDDFTDGLMKVIDQGEHLNIYHIGTQEEVTMRELALKVAECMGAIIEIIPDKEAVGGTQRRCPDTAKLRALGFAPKFTLATGLPPTVLWYADHAEPERKISTPPLFPLPLHE